jgi:hypothetical protein
MHFASEKNGSPRNLLRVDAGNGRKFFGRTVLFRKQGYLAVSVAREKENFFMLIKVDIMSGKFGQNYFIPQRGFRASCVLSA